MYVQPPDRVKTRKRTRISTTVRPQVSSTTPKLVSNAPSRRRRPQPFERVTPGPIKFTTGSYTPITVEYDYYDEGDVRVFGQLPANSKVSYHTILLHMYVSIHYVYCSRYSSITLVRSNVWIRATSRTQCHVRSLSRVPKWRMVM